MAEWTSTLRMAVRSALRNRGFAALVILTSGLGVGAATAAFSAVNGVLLRPLPFAHASELVYVGMRFGGLYSDLSVVSVPDFIDFKERLTTLESLSALTPRRPVVFAENGAERLPGARVSPDFFRVVGVTPQIGRPFVASEFETGATPAVIVSHGLWQRRWGGDPDVLGRSIQMPDGPEGQLRSYAVVGVLPEDFDLPSGLGFASPQIWMPLPVDGEAYAGGRTSRTLRVIGRPRAGVSLEVVRQDMASLTRSMVADYPRAYQWGDGYASVDAVPLLEQVVGSVDRTLVLFLGATGLLVLIGAANVAHLLLARSATRSSELAIRTALGAGRGRIVRQLLWESVVLGALSGVVGIGLSVVGVRALHALGPSGLPRLSDIRVDGMVLAFGLSVALAVSLLFGLAPAFSAARTSPAATMREGGARSGVGRRQRRSGAALLVWETAMAMVLLCGSGLLVRSYAVLRAVDPGFEPTGLHALGVTVGVHYDGEDRARFFEDLRTRALALPGVESVSMIADEPLSFYGYWVPNVHTETSDPERPVQVLNHTVGPDYFATMGIELLRGRGITERDRADGAPVIVVSEVAARTLWPGEDPLGKRIRFSTDPERPSLSVVGLVRDVHQENLRTEPRGEMYVPYAAYPYWSTMSIMIRGDVATATLGNVLRTTLRSMDPDIPFDGVVPMEEIVADALLPTRFAATLLSVFAFVALTLAAAGIYGTLQYLVNRQRHEIGVRMALGADAGRVVAQVLRAGMAPAGTGIVVGLVATVFLSRLLANLVFGVPPLDLTTFAAVGGVLAAAALLACVQPAARAARTDPMASLRAE